MEREHERNVMTGCDTLSDARQPKMPASLIIHTYNKKIINNRLTM
jgi:hypothetical protein